MSDFVLDNSVAMRWLFQSNKAGDQKYAERVLTSMMECEALVPNLWHLEAANVLLSAEKRSEISVGESEAFISQLEHLPITVDFSTAENTFSKVMALSRAFKLSSYDGAYLELALRESLPLATLDKSLIKAAKKSGVNIYLLSD